jgi:hypothetical protein
VPKDESDTAVWSEEMAGAYAVASPLLEAGDAIGARMAFKETYDRLVREAREQRKPAAWTISLGWDTDKRTTAIRNAISAGRYLESKAQHLLPPPSDVGPIGALLEGRQLALPHDLPESDKEFARRKFAELRQQIENTPSRWERHCAERDKARAAENQARAQQLAKVNERIPGEEG